MPEVEKELRIPFVVEGLKLVGPKDQQASVLDELTTTGIGPDLGQPLELLEIPAAALGLVQGIRDGVNDPRGNALENLSRLSQAAPLVALDHLAQHFRGLSEDIIPSNNAVGSFVQAGAEILETIVRKRVKPNTNVIQDLTDSVIVINANLNGPSVGDFKRGEEFLTLLGLDPDEMRVQHDKKVA